MTKYLTEERFLVTSNDKDGRRNYLDNYDRIFRQEAEPEPAKDSDANFEPPPHVATFPVEGPVCTCPHQDANESMHDAACPSFKEKPLWMCGDCGATGHGGYHGCPVTNHLYTFE